MWVDLLEIRPSRLQRRVRLFSMLLIGALLLLSGMAEYAKLLALVGLILLGWQQQRRQQQQPQLGCLQQLDRVRWQWQQTAAIGHARTRQLRGQTNRIPRVEPRQIQADLQSVEGWLGMVVVLRFKITALDHVHTWLIWRDQVDQDNWRRLQVLQQYWSAPVKV